MTKMYRVLLASLIIVLILSACGGGDGDKASSTEKATATIAPESALQQPTQASPSEPLPTKASALVPAQPTEAPSGESGGVGALGDLLNLGTLKTNPEELSSESLQSYRLRAGWSIEPKAEGAMTAISTEFEVAHTSDPLAEEIVFSSGDEGFVSRMIHIGDRIWIQAGEQWVEMSSDDMGGYEDMLLTLDSATADLAGDAKLVGQEKLGGVDTLHYAFDDSLLGAGLGIYSKIKGDVWVAVDGEYVVKYVYTAEDDEATYRWSWEVYDINAPFTIEPPADAQGARDDVPIMPDATDRASYGAMVTYSTASDLKTVIEFYKTEMPANGWTYDEAGSMVSDQFAMLNFSKEGEMANVTLSPEDTGGTAVVIQAGE